MNRGLLFSWAQISQIKLLRLFKIWLQNHDMQRVCVLLQSINFYLNSSFLSKSSEFLENCSALDDATQHCTAEHCTTPTHSLAHKCHFAIVSGRVRVIGARLPVPEIRRNKNPAQRSDSATSQFSYKGLSIKIRLSANCYFCSFCKSKQDFEVLYQFFI